MATRPHRGPGPRRRAGHARALARMGVLLGVAGLLVVLIAPVPPARAGGQPPESLVQAALGGWGGPGVLAVAVARQQQPADGLSLRGAEARAARVAASRGDNGDLAGRPFPTASMVKLFVAEDVLHRARAGVLVLSAADRDLLREMIRRSDDPAASALWVRFGGGRMVTDVVARYDLTGTAPPPAHIPGQWGQAVTTARDLARFLALLPVLAHPEDAAALLGWMAEATQLAADGFDQQFGLFGALPEQPAVKQGWMCCVAGQRHLHSVAVVGSRVVVLLSEVPAAAGYDRARAGLDAAAAAVATVLATPLDR
jgi:Beta-lactamase enzyme family